MQSSTAMEIYDSAKQVACRASQQVAERASVVGERVASKWATHKPTTKLGWMVSE